MNRLDAISSIVMERSIEALDQVENALHTLDADIPVVTRGLRGAEHHLRAAKLMLELAIDKMENV